MQELRMMLEKFTDDLTKYTYSGDTVLLQIEHRKLEKPQIRVQFSSSKLGSRTEDYTSLLPENPWYVERHQIGYDVEKGVPIYDEQRRGALTWKEFVHFDMGPCFAMRRGAEIGGRLFSVEEK